MNLAPLIVLIALTLLNACGLFLKSGPHRTVASVENVHELGIDQIESKLEHIHIHYMLAQKQMLLFDQQPESLKTDKRYSSSPYLKLQAIKSQVQKIELELISELKSYKGRNDKEFYFSAVEIFKSFAQKSFFHAYSVDNMMNRLALENIFLSSKRPTEEEIQKEISDINKTAEFQVFDQNIEHLAFMFETRDSNSAKHFFPSATAAGSITGDEFPSKVWSLTFDGGPQADISSQITEKLKEQQLTATFFMTTGRAKENPKSARLISSSGMEIASNGYSEQQLTKVGSNRLENEITLAVKELNQIQKGIVRFFRLPLGSGATVPAIREKIAANNLIHVLWNVDSLDWVPQPPDQITDRIIDLMNMTDKDAGIILLHDTYQRTLLAMPKIMKHLKHQNRRVCTINKIIDHMNKGLETVCPSK
jgi:peptidoglycan/xylan/chitin deacetylase (PgdA/CDA1 family)